MNCNEVLIFVSNFAVHDDAPWQDITDYSTEQPSLSYDTKTLTLTLPHGLHIRQRGLEKEKKRPNPFAGKSTEQMSCSFRIVPGTGERYGEVVYVLDGYVVMNGLILQFMATHPSRTSPTSRHSRPVAGTIPKLQDVCSVDLPANGLAVFKKRANRCLLMVRMRVVRHRGLSRS